MKAIDKYIELIRKPDKKELKKADFTVVSVPTYVEGECPYCEEDFEVDYNDFGNSDYPGDWKGETIECPNCEKEIVIDDVDWD